MEKRTLLSVATINAATVVRSVPSDLIGINTAPWDGLLSSSQTLSLSQAAGIDAVRIGGGSSADTWHFNATTNSESIGQMADYAAELNATAVVTVDYGEGSPQEAVALWAYLDGSPSDNYSIGNGEQWNGSEWVSVNWGTVGQWASLRANTTVSSSSLGADHPAAFNFSYFEIGNEVYGSWETDEHGQAGDDLPMPAGDSPKPHDPTTMISFAVQFQNEINAILSDGSESGAKPILIGYDSQAVDNSQLAGSDYTDWMVQTLQQSVAQGLDLGFIADHYYAQNSGGESDSGLLGVSNKTTSATNPYDWAQRASDYDALFAEYDPGANIQLIADEVNSVSSNPDKQSTSLVNGLFIADALGSALETTGTDGLGGYDGFFVWDLHNGPVTNSNPSGLYGWRTYGDYGILGNGQTSTDKTNELTPDYFALELGSEFLQPGGTVVASSEDNESNMDVYAVLEANGDLDLLIVNKTNPNSGTPPDNLPDPTLTEQFNLSGFTAGGQAEISEYGVAQDDAQANSSTYTASLENFNTTLAISGDSFSYAIPDYTMMVIALTPGPVLTQAAAADPNPVTGTTTALSAAATENGSGSALTYTWSATSVPAGVTAPTYSANGTNAAANTIATFYGAGSYSFLVTITDPSNNSITSSVNVTVNQTPTGVMVSPSSITDAVDSQQQFSASATDQFGNSISSPSFTWSITGTSDGNSISSSGLATLGSTPGNFTVTAQLGSASNIAQITAAAVPSISSFQINDGSAQRSMIDSLTLTFNEAVNIGNGAISLDLLSQTGGSPTPMSFTLATPDGGTTWVLTFTGGSYIGSSLPNGAYQLSVSASGVSGAAGGLNMSSNQSYEFWRLYGDFQGNGVVNSVDFGSFATVFGTSTTPSNWFMDYDGNGVINSVDFGAFAVDFGTSISIPAVQTPAVTTPSVTTPPPPTNTTTSNSPANLVTTATTTTTPPAKSPTKVTMAAVVPVTIATTDSTASQQASSPDSSLLDTTDGHERYDALIHRHRH